MKIINLILNTLPSSRPQPNHAALLAAFLLAVACLPGCATATGGGSPAAWLADLRDVAQVGAQIDLLEHPGHRAAYAQAVTALDAISSVEHLTPAELHGALLNLPIKELRGERAVLYVTAAQILMRRVLDGKEPVAVPGAVRDLAAALRDGLASALSQTPQ